MLGRRRRPSPWLNDARFDAGLLIPGHPTRHAADLRLAPDGVEVGAQGIDATSLDWADLRSSLTSSGGRADWWAITPWSPGRGGQIGVGIAVDGRYVERTAGVRRATRSWRNRLNRFLQDGIVVPLCAVGHISWAVDRDRNTVELLCALLVERPDLRGRLAEQDRISELIRGLQTSKLDMPPYRMGARRATTEILTALRLLGYEHRFHGRPLPGEVLPEIDEIVPRVLERIRSNRFAAGVVVDEDQVRSVVKRDYLDVEPWPVDALMR